MTGRPLLILVPTQLELDLLGGGGAFEGRAIVRVVGLGPVAGAAETARLLALFTPARALLLGIAGSYDLAAAPIGTARRPSTVRCHDIGALAPDDGRVVALPLPQLAHPPVHDAITLESGDGCSLCTVHAASGSLVQARARALRSGAVLEDMEGFGFALACRAAGVPASIVRGVSNLAGERDQARWRIGDALAAARTAARSWCEE